MATKKKKVTAATGAADKPTLNAILATAGRAFGRHLQDYTLFCEQYVLATELYGRDGKKAFHEKWAYYTDSMWSHAEAIGKHVLLAHFAIASDTMIAGLLRLKDSMKKQMLLVGAMEDGKIETVSANGTVVLKSLDQLSKLDELGIVFALNSATAPGEIRKYAYEFRKEWAKGGRRSRPDFERIGDFLRVNHAIKALTRRDWSAMGVMMGWV